MEAGRLKRELRGRVAGKVSRRPAMPGTLDVVVDGTPVYSLKGEHRSITGDELLERIKKLQPPAPV